MKKSKILITIALLFVVSLAVADESLRPSQGQSAGVSRDLKLPYSNGDLLEGDWDVPNVAPIALPGGGSLITVGDVAYLVDSSNQVVWKRSVEPNIIFDVVVDSKGLIYLAVSDGLLFSVDHSGKQVWSTSMIGSANYTQLEPYLDGVLAVISMEAYRKFKNSNSDDILVFWREKKEVWRKEFPRNADLYVSGNRILAISSLKTGKEIREIR